MDWPLLKQVSRSFYLTLRLLPPPVRESMALAYLLARVTDTEADGAATDAERQLLARRGEIKSWLEKSKDRAEIGEVWTMIQQGQEFDRERFSASKEALTPEELDRYTYLVAGCVGEFWTTLCAKRIPDFARLPREEMTRLGIRFGKGLQLVNILRDRRADAEIGRVYLPREGISAALGRARECLRDAARYTRALRGWRLRAACALPYLLALETLDLVERQPDTPRVKVTRGRVWWLLLQALAFR